MPASSPKKVTRRRQAVGAEGEARGNDDTADGIELKEIGSKKGPGNKYRHQHHHNGRRLHRPRHWFDVSCPGGGSSGPLTHRTALTASVFLFMVGVAGSIIGLVFFFLAPDRPVRRWIAVERSRYDPEHQWDGVDGGANDVVLGARPAPAVNPYVSSTLESYVMENGRNDAMGFDRQIRAASASADEDDSDRPSLRNPVLEAHAALFGTRRPKNPRTYVDYTDPRNTDQLPSGCELYFDEDVTDESFRDSVDGLRASLKTYRKLLDGWVWVPPPLPVIESAPSSPSLWSGLWGGDETPPEELAAAATTGDDDRRPRKPDLRRYFDADDANRDEVCETLELHPDGIAGIFHPPAQQLSKITKPSSSSVGDYFYPTKRIDSIFLEPLLPPLRHPEFCYELRDFVSAGANDDRGKTKKRKKPRTPVPPGDRLSDAGFVVHDFASLCRHKLRKTGTTVFVDLGSFGAFRPAADDDESPDARLPPTLELIRLHERFGFVFDHVYAYDAFLRRPSEVFSAIPDDLKPAYHWYNVGVDPVRDGSYANPLSMVARSFGPEDFVVVKLDGALPSARRPPPRDDDDLAVRLADQILADPALRDTVDAVYFADRAAVREAAPLWGDSMTGSMQDSMEFVRSLREHGIAAHYWV